LASKAPSSRLFASQANDISINERNAQKDGLDMIVDNTAYRNEVVRSDELSAKGNLQKDPTFDSIRSFTYPHP